MSSNTKKVPLSNKEKKARYNAKLTEDKKAAYLEKQRICMKELCLKKKKQFNQLTECQQNLITNSKQEYERKRKADYRQSKKSEDTAGKIIVSGLGSYSRKSTLGKAVARVKRALPNSPRKTTAVVKRLCEHFDIQPGELTKKRTLVAIQVETIDCVKQFYLRDDISHQAPGKQDVIVVRDNNGKQKLQKKHIGMSVNEAYGLFKNEYPNLKIGKSKFAEFRPKHVLLTRDLPRNVCMCEYHANMILKLESLHHYIESIPTYTHKFPENCICVSATKECWLNNCDECLNGKLFLERYHNNEITEYEDVQWFQWETTSVTESFSALQKVQKETSLQEVFDFVISGLPSFLKHCYIKRCQSVSYEKDKEHSLTLDGYASLQIDFAENYSCVWQDEVQSAHWCKNQVTIFTAVMWSKNLTQVLLLFQIITITRKSPLSPFLISYWKAFYHKALNIYQFGQMVHLVSLKTAILVFY